MKILIETIPHAKQPYPTAGDWRRDADGALHVRVSEEIGDEYALLVAIHELLEAVLCENNGVSCAAVDNFDLKFEKQRPPGNLDEPGDHPDAPYREEHCVASGIERVMAGLLGVSWSDYEHKLDGLAAKYPQRHE
jgi:hypothetical protein